MILADRTKADVDEHVELLEPFLAERVEQVVVEGDLRGWCKEASEDRKSVV